MKFSYLLKIVVISLEPEDGNETNSVFLLEGIAERKEGLNLIESKTWTKK